MQEAPVDIANSNGPVIEGDDDDESRFNTSSLASVDSQQPQIQRKKKERTSLQTTVELNGKRFDIRIDTQTAQELDSGYEKKEKKKPQ